MTTILPRLVIAGLAGDSGKTIVSLSLTAALRRQGLAVSTFKKGPDYIDAAWLTYISKKPCRNLDTYMVAPEDVYRIFTNSSEKSDISLIEGNRGIFDGKDVSGTHSTAGLAKLLRAPVVLVIDVTKTTRTVAAIIKGCLEFDSEVKFAGIIINKIAGQRHKQLIIDSIEKYCNLPVLGAIPKLDVNSSLIPGRHLGLVTPYEFKQAAGFEDKLNLIAEKYLDIKKIIAIANNAEPLATAGQEILNSNIEKKVKIGYFSDSVFTFYYPENLEALTNNGAELTPISSLEDKELPEIDALYIGGGFPETHAEHLVENKSMMESVRKAAVAGMPIYAECGGLIYLSRSLVWKKSFYPMADVFPLDLVINKKPIGHGYTSLTVDSSNPFYVVGTIIKGHEFHYTGVSQNQDEAGIGQIRSCFNVENGAGFGNKRDGLVFNNTLACYTHIHAAGVKDWASALVQRAQIYHEKILENGDTHNYNGELKNNFGNGCNRCSAIAAAYSLKA